MANSAEFDLDNENSCAGAAISPEKTNSIWQKGGDEQWPKQIKSYGKPSCNGLK